MNKFYILLFLLWNLMIESIESKRLHENRQIHFHRNQHALHTINESVRKNKDKLHQRTCEQIQNLYCLDVEVR
jgi:hypothetical protein